MLSLQQKIQNRLWSYKNTLRDYPKKFSDQTLWVYQSEPRNWGDQLNYDLLTDMLNLNVGTVSKPNKHIPKEVFYMIGSVLHHIEHPNAIVWGSGMISSDEFPPVAPKKIYAVRGPLTRARLKTKKMECPEIFGDPALLYPFFYRPNRKKTHRLGIIPHYYDHPSEGVKNLIHQGALFIDIFGGIKKVVNQISSCSAIASSSLHGLIAADAYGIPNLWVEFSNNVHGHGFKFRDYFLSVERKTHEPFQVTARTLFPEIEDRLFRDQIKIDLEPLIEACPFKSFFSKKADTWLKSKA